MNKFGKLKSKLLTKLTEAYVNKDNKTLKTIIKQINENKDLKDMFLYYDNFENKYITESEIVDEYINEIQSILYSKNKNLTPLYENLMSLVAEVETTDNPIYDMLDTLVEEKSLSNIESKLSNRNKIKKHLLTQKEEIVSEGIKNFTQNEKLLVTLLTTEFNNKFSDNLTESDKKEFEEIITLTPEQLDENFNNTKTDVLQKIDSLINEDSTEEYVDKLKQVKEQINTEDYIPNRLNFYKLKQLNKDL